VERDRKVSAGKVIGQGTKKKGRGLVVGGGGGRDGGSEEREGGF